MGFDFTKQVIDKAIENHTENGVSFILTRGGRTELVHSAGLADVEKKIGFSEKTICRVYSLTKIVTSTACMMLMERGKLDTGWRLDWVIPEFTNAREVSGGAMVESPPIKIRDLLNMTAGIPYPGDWHEGSDGMSSLWAGLENGIRFGNSMTTCQFAAAAGGMPLVFPAGQEWMYGSSADILGAVIEKVSGTELSEFFAQNIFRPLGMEDTAFFVPPEKRDRLAVLYENVAAYPIKPNYVNLCIFDYDKNPRFQSAGAGLFSTAEDFSKLGAALSNGGGGIISQRAIDFMRENGLTAGQRQTYNWESTRGFGYGNLVRCLEDRNAAGLFATKGSFGWDGWTGTYMLCDPAEKLSITVFIQRCGAGTTQLSRDIVNTVYSAL